MVRLHFEYSAALISKGSVMVLEKKKADQLK